MNFIVLAAGAGSRMRTSEPKPLADFCFAKMIDFVLAACAGAAGEMAGTGAGAAGEMAGTGAGAAGGNCEKSGFSPAVAAAVSGVGTAGAEHSITVVVGHQGERVADYLRAHYPGLQIAAQDMSKKGSAAALFGLTFAAEADYIVLSCDMPLISAALLSRLAAHPADVALAAFEAAEPGAYGRVICDAAGRFAKIVEAKDASAAELESRLCNGGVYKLRGAVLQSCLGQISPANAAGEYYLTDICALAAAAGYSVAALRESEAELAGVNDLAQLARAEAAMFERIADGHRRAGNYVAAGARIDARARLLNGCRIASGVVIKGAAKLDAAEILENSVIESSLVRQSCVGPLARLRPGCEILRSKIGNFVECKAAAITGAKAGHHAYLGDCEVGEGANIGCGVIVCNYDGRSKQRSSVGAGAFVGSNSCIIAPAAVPERAYIAANSTITARDADALGEGGFFIARARGVCKPPRE